METKETKVKIDLPDKVEMRIEDKYIIAKGTKGENRRDISNPILNISAGDGSVHISALGKTKREKKLVLTYAAHIRNMIKGVTEGHKYILKICSSHFPMNISVNKNELIIKNFVGEKHPRILKFKEGVDVKVEGDNISVEGTDLELVGTAASDIEKITKRPNFDTRIFQDGIFIINKNGKEIK